MSKADYTAYSRPVTVEFDLDSTKILSPLYFGDNLEHTRDCVNSGISAQMLKNRKFIGKPDRLGCALGWDRIGSNAHFHLHFEHGYTRHGEGYSMTRAHECQGQIIINYDTAPAGIGQSGLFLRGGERYRFSLAAKVFKPVTVQVALLASDGTVLAREEILAEDSSYALYETALVPGADEENGRLEVTFAGENTMTVGAVSLMSADNFRGMRWDVIGKMKELGIRFLRWPGGNFSGEYHWKDGLLPRDQRAPVQSYLWIETQPHTWGYDFHEINTDDFLCLCEEIGAEPFITINPTWNTPQDSADWVEYCKGEASTPYGALRAKNGRVEPYHVKFWSLGNEFGYGHMEGTNGPGEYAAAVRLHAEKMLSVSPDLRLCSSGPYPDGAWAEQSAKALSDVAQVVSLHHYAEYPMYIDPDKREQEYYGFISKPDTEYLPRIQQLRQQLGDDLTISFDEWNAWYAWYPHGSVTEGIFAAHLLNMMYRNAEKYGVSQICHFESVNEGAMLVTRDKAELMPTGQAIASMADHAGGRILALQEDVTVTEKDGIITCTLLNRSYAEDKTFHLPKVGAIAGGKLLSGNGVVVGSRFAEGTLTVEEKEDYLVTLPKHSIAVVKIVM